MKELFLPSDKPVRGRAFAVLLLASCGLYDCHAAPKWVLGESFNVVVIQQYLAAFFCCCGFKMYLRVSEGGHCFQYLHMQYWHMSDSVSSICTHHAIAACWHNGVLVDFNYMNLYYTGFCCSKEYLHGISTAVQ